MIPYRYTIGLTLQGPALSQASGARGVGVDTIGLRDDSESPVLPGSLVRGNLRHTWELFAGLDSTAGVPTEGEIKSWLGEQSGPGSQPRPARLSFSEYWVAKGACRAALRNRIQQNERTGAVEPGALQVIESPIGTTEQVLFEGWIEAHLTDEKEAERLALWIRKGLEFVPAMGALKGTGFGRVLHVEVRLESRQTAASVWTHEVGDGFGLRLKLDRAFCFARHHAVNNRFESADFIPGAAILGTIARRLGLPGESGASGYQSLCRHFNEIRITHAFPVPATQNCRPSVPPFSVVSAPDAEGSENRRLYDVALKAKPGLIHRRAPAFEPDWKRGDWALLPEHCGWGVLPRTLVVRTAINRASGAPKTGALFAIEAVKPDGYHWLADVELSRIGDASDRERVAKELQTLLLSEGLSMLGKTKARATVEIVPKRHSPAAASKGLLQEKIAILTLQSAARLLPHYQGSPANGDNDLKQAYAIAWSKLSGESLKLKYFYTRQQLAGGGYLWSRFRGRVEPYNPELLTLPGSVFVLEATKPEYAQKYLHSWLAYGLPQLQNAPGGENWEKTPYIATNGYGEITVNLSLHWELEPGEGVWYELD